MQHLVGTSDGDGNVLEIENNPDELDKDFSPDELEMDSFDKFNESDESGDPVEFVQENPFEGYSTVVDEKDIPDSLAHVFNKITECIVDGVTWKYRELNELDKMALGDTPLLEEALTSFDEKNATLDTERFVQDLVNRSPEQINEINRRVILYRDNILLTSLISVRAGDDEIEINEAVIATLNDNTKNQLRDIIWPPDAPAEEQAEIDSAKRFRKKRPKKPKSK